MEKSKNSNSPRDDCSSDVANIKKIELDNRLKQYSHIIKLLDTTRQNGEITTKKQKPISRFRQLKRFLKLKL